MNAVVFPMEAATRCSGHSSNEARIEPDWALASPSADGALKPTTAGSTRAICLIADASLPWTYRGSRFPRLRSVRTAAPCVGATADLWLRALRSWLAAHAVGRSAQGHDAGRPLNSDGHLHRA